MQPQGKQDSLQPASFLISLVTVQHKHLITNCGARFGAQVVACPGGVAVGHTYFIPSEEHLESGITTRAFMEAKLVVCLAGRCAY
jgi:hypothetical protein